MQLFFSIVFYAACVYKIVTEDAEVHNAVFGFYNAIFYCLITSFLLIINAIILTLVVRGQKLIELKNYYPPLFYLLFSFLFPTVLNPLVLFAGLVFMLGIFPNLFDLEEHNINRKIFRYGFCVGILALLHFPLIVLLFFAYLTCLTYRRFSFRIFFLPIISVLSPFLYWYSALYILGYDFSFQENIQQMRESLLQFQFFNLTETPITLISTLFLLILWLRLLYFLWSFSGKSAVLRRKKYYILLVLFLFSMVLAFLYSQYYIEIVLMMYSIVLSLYLMFTKKKRNY